MTTLLFRSVGMVGSMGGGMEPLKAFFTETPPALLVFLGIWAVLLGLFGWYRNRRHAAILGMVAKVETGASADANATTMDVVGDLRKEMRKDATFVAIDVLSAAIALLAILLVLNVLVVRSAIIKRHQQAADLQGQLNGKELRIAQMEQASASSRDALASKDAEIRALEAAAQVSSNTLGARDSTIRGLKENNAKYEEQIRQLERKAGVSAGAQALPQVDMKNSFRLRMGNTDKLFGPFACINNEKIALGDTSFEVRMSETETAPPHFSLVSGKTGRTYGPFELINDQLILVGTTTFHIVMADQK